MEANKKQTSFGITDCLTTRCSSPCTSAFNWHDRKQSGGEAGVIRPLFLPGGGQRSQNSMDRERSEAMQKRDARPATTDRGDLKSLRAPGSERLDCDHRVTQVVGVGIVRPLLLWSAIHSTHQRRWPHSKRQVDRHERNPEGLIVDQSRPQQHPTIHAACEQYSIITAHDASHQLQPCCMLIRGNKEKSPTQRATLTWLNMVD